MYIIIIFFLSDIYTRILNPHIPNKLMQEIYPATDNTSIRTNSYPAAYNLIRTWTNTTQDINVQDKCHLVYINYAEKLGLCM